ncbi:MAG: FAD-dependent oxidoreductase [Candidatus Pacearchaeota archaeon]
MKNMNNMKYDLIIIGGGPAGLTAAIYAARYKLKVKLYSKTMGGLASTAYMICNYPSYIEIKGFELMQKMIKQVENLGVEIVYDEIESIENKKEFFILKSNSEVIETKKIIIATGTERVRLNIPGEGKFYGKGVSYCATCDAPFYKNKTAVVIGGGDAALTSAILLTEYAKKVYLIYRREKFFRAEPAWIDIVEKNKKIEIIFKEEITEIFGDQNVEGVTLKSGKKLKSDGVFIETGSIPEKKLTGMLGIKLDESGYIITDRDQKTNVKGVFAAGDITNNSLKQIVTATGEGAVAAFNAYKEVKKND